MPASIADWGQSAAGWESPSPERPQESPAVVAVGSQTRCLQNESVWYGRCLQFESTISKEVQGKHSVPCPPCRNLRFPAPHSLGAANRAAAEIACRLHLPPAAAARNSHDTLQPLDESIIVGYALSAKCVTHYVLSHYLGITKCSM